MKKTIYSLILLAMSGSLQMVEAQNSGCSVGTPQGSLSVSDMGAAAYNLSIDVPDGGALTPQIGLAYNSQMNGYGLAGYGFNITGISCITRGGKDLFHDKTVAGVTYSETDNLFLDGKRMILESGEQGKDGSVYTLEGDPYTKITLLVKSKLVTQIPNNDIVSPDSDEALVSASRGTKYLNDTCFEVKTANGLTHLYETKLLAPRIVAWYIDRTTDKYSNYIEYNYGKKNYCIYPTEIKYGFNDSDNGKRKGVTNSLTFSYDTLGVNARYFAIGKVIGKMDVCLSSVSTSSDGNLYRKYLFSYDRTSDQTLNKWTRLIQIDEENGDGEKLAPVVLNWEFLPTLNLSTNQSNASVDNGNGNLDEISKYFFSSDVNGDGISDIIRLSHIGSKSAIDHDKYSLEWFELYVNKSKVDGCGSIKYDNLSYRLDDLINIACFQTSLDNISISDIDGDGYGDIVIPYRTYVEKDLNDIIFYVIYGSDIKDGKEENCQYSYTEQLSIDTSNDPLLTTIDVDGDGKDEIIAIEKGLSGGYGKGFILDLNGKKSGSKVRKDFSFILSKTPKSIFAGDYNKDGLTDLLILHDNGYKIYFNNGGSDISTIFNDKNCISGTNLSNSSIIEQGDFNGDGLVDIVFYDSSLKSIQIAFNTGNGNFSVKSSSIFDAGTIAGDCCGIIVNDINHDGISDIVVNYCYLYYHTTLWNYAVCSQHMATKFILLNSEGEPWIYKSNDDVQSDAQMLPLDSDFDSYSCSKRQNDFLGDFDGDGFIEIATYGTPLIGFNTSSDKVAIYKSGSDLSQLGKITSIKDGMGNASSIQYACATDPAVYGYSGNSYDLPNTNLYTVPLSVVSSITGSNGTAANQTVNYEYKDLLVNTNGRGMLGFVSTINKNLTQNTQSETTITDWDKTRLLPTEVTSTSSIGGTQATSISKFTIEKVDSTYFCYCSQKEETDLDGNKTSTFMQYNTKYGVILSDSTSYDGKNMYKKVLYSDYQQKAGVWLPASVTQIQKHSDASTKYSTTKKNTYDDYGNIVSSVSNFNTDFALTTVNTYDEFGNVTSTVSTGKNVIPVKQHYLYDDTKRFVVKSYTEPESSVTTYTYDRWGNVLTETDATDSSNPLTTTYTYDGWGRKTSKTDIYGLKTTYETGWISDSSYYTKVIPTAAPAVTTTYDGTGRELNQTTTGLKGIDIVKTNVYNELGLLTQVENKTGDLVILRLIDYDSRNRIVRDSLSSGQTTVYSYGNRTVSMTTAGRTTAQTSDAWGNPIKIVDPINGTVEYKYKSLGKPFAITSNGSVVRMKYDDAGNQIELRDPDAGVICYSYAADGTLLWEKDALNDTTRCFYDDLGRVTKKTIGDKTTVYSYGTSGNAKLRLVSESMDGNSISYDEYDKYGRVVKESRTMSDGEVFTYTYAYNDKNQLTSTTYPGGVVETYTYDDNGFKIQTKVGNKTIYSLTSYNGKDKKSLILEKLVRTSKHDSRGYLTTMKIETGNTILDSLITVYDGATNNLLSRQRMGCPRETFGYDALDRLVSVSVNGTASQKMVYASNGNITSKSDVGTYSYSQHAVQMIENQPTPLKSACISTTFNSLGKIQQIKYDATGQTMDFVYGPDQQRWKTILSDTIGEVRATTYAGSYERVSEGDVTREFYYLDGNVIMVRENGVLTPYLAFKDNLGSYLSIMDENGDKVFDASYDAWGKQTIALNDISFQRGYTGHEMLNEFDIINMNGRLYDPTIARFLSPDNYVQAPDNSQNFNRYSYCLNNPLKYTDPSGDFWEWVIAGAIMGAIQSGAMADMNGGNFWNGAWKGAIVGAGSAAAGMGVGAAVTSALGGTSAIAGFASGFAGGAVSGFASGSSSAWLNGGSLKSGLQSGLYSCGVSAAIGGTIGGLHGGISAHNHGGNFWTGKGILSDFEIPFDFEIEKEKLKEINPIAEESIPYTNSDAKIFSNKWFGEMEEYVDNLYADGTLPPGGDYEYRDNGYVYRKSGKSYVGGTTRYNGIGKGSNVYLYKSSFSSSTSLYLTMGHEYLHAYYNANGLAGMYNGMHAYIYEWQSMQEEQWGMYSLALAHARRAESYWLSTPNIYKHAFSVNQAYELWPTRPWLAY